MTTTVPLPVRVAPTHARHALPTLRMAPLAGRFGGGIESQMAADFARRVDELHRRLSGSGASLGSGRLLPVESGETA